MKYLGFVEKIIIYKIAMLKISRASKLKIKYLFALPKICEPWDGEYNHNFTPALKAKSEHTDYIRKRWSISRHSTWQTILILKLEITTYLDEMLSLLGGEDVIYTSHNTTDPPYSQSACYSKAASPRKSETPVTDLHSIRDSEFWIFRVNSELLCLLTAQK